MKSLIKTINFCLDTKTNRIQTKVQKLDIQFENLEQTFPNKKIQILQVLQIL